MIRMNTASYRNIRVLINPYVFLLKTKSANPRQKPLSWRSEARLQWPKYLLCGVTNHRSGGTNHLCVAELHRIAAKKQRCYGKCLQTDGPIHRTGGEGKRLLVRVQSGVIVKNCWFAKKMTGSFVWIEW